MKGLKNKRQSTVTFVVTATYSFFLIKLIYQGKSKRCFRKFIFPSDFHVTVTANHSSNLEKCGDLFNVIIVPYFSAKKKKLGYLEEHCSLIIMDTFKSQDNDKMKRLSTKNNWQFVIVPHNLNDKFQPLDVSINQTVQDSFYTSSAHGMLI